MDASYGHLEDGETHKDPFIVGDVAQSGFLRRVCSFSLVSLSFVGLLAIATINQNQPRLASEETLDAAPGPALQHFKQIANMHIPKMPDAQGSNSYITDIVLSTVPGKEMAGGLYKLDAGPVLRYNYTYEEFKLVIDGEFHVTDGTGQTVVAKKGDLMYFPVGTRTTFSTPSTALGYFIGQRISPDAAVPLTPKVQAAIASNPKIVLFPQIATASNLAKIPLLANTDDSKSYLQDLAVSNVPGKEMTVGLYLDKVGPALHYTYGYEEFKYVMDGEYYLTDGTGQRVIARKGDLLYFPKGAKIVFETPAMALGFFCGQRKGGTA